MTANPGTDKVEAVAVELRLDRISRLYNSLDPAPFHEKELEAAADEYIVGSAEDVGGRPFRLVIMLPQDELARPEAAQIPVAYGGGGASWLSVLRVVREFARTDG